MVLLKFICIIVMSLCLLFSSKDAETLLSSNSKPDISAAQQAQLPEDRIKSLESVRKLSDYSYENLYSMEIFYDYDLDALTPVGVYDDSKLDDLILEQVLPGVQLDFIAPSFGCSAFSVTAKGNEELMGRNYDFKYDTSSMIVLCHPKDGYASVAHAALNNLRANDPFSSENALLSTLLTPFACLDGMNEKGVGIAVLTLDGTPTKQDTGRPVLSTSMLVRLILDQAADTEEAIRLIRAYDVYATSGRDYHFFITDLSGNSVVVEFNPDMTERKMIVTPSRSVTNFYISFSDQVSAEEKNGRYGHGKDRFEKMEAIFDAAEGRITDETAWEALKAASQTPDPESITSNTQWSALFNLKDLTYEFVLHRHWDDTYRITLLRDYLGR